MKADVTIIMPTYNKDKYISDALDSVLMQQTDYKYQIIVADDCSTDGTVAIVEDYKKKFRGKILLLKSKKNQKLFKNVIRAYKKTKAKYFSVLDPDDYWTDKLKIQRALDFLEGHKDYTVYFSNTKIERFDDKNTKSDACEKYVWTDNSYDFDFNGYLRNSGSFGHTSSTVFRNVIFKKGIPYKMRHLSSPTQETTFRGDTFRNLIHIYEGKGHYEPIVDSVYRITNEGIWTRLSRQDQLLLNMNLFKDLHIYFDKKYLGLLYRAYVTFRELRSQNILGAGASQVKDVEAMCSSAEFQDYLKSNVCEG